MSGHNNFTRVFDILAYQQARFPQEKAINIFSENRWHATSIYQLIEKVNTISCWLISKGLNQGDMIAIMPKQGNLDWIGIDLACQQLGIIIVPIQPALAEEELMLILSETKPKLMVLADNELYKHVEALKDIELNLLYLGGEHDDVNNFNIAYKHKSNDEEIKQLAQIKQSIKPNDLLAIMYTSGTSGQPKGTLLTHQNMVSNILFTLAAFPLESGKKVMSYLPFSHIMERATCYAYLTCGVSIYFVRNGDTFLADFQSAKPYFTTAVPKVLETMYAYLQELTLAQNWLKRNITNWSLNVARAYNKSEKKSLALSFKLVIARLLVFNRWKNQLGGKLQCIVVGAAALQPEIARMFSAAKIRIREGYGMTEASPLISLNRFAPGLNRFGTVGIPIPAISIKIEQESEDGEGEILIKGPNVTQGYFKRPELNKTVFTEDGWFKTGDVGRFIDGKFLQITDRKKDIFKTSSGKYIAPQPLENILKTSPFILQALVFGLGRPFVSALIVPNFNFLEDWCRSENIHWTAAQYIIYNIKVVEKFNSEIDLLNEALPAFKQIQKYILCEEVWSTENKLLTTTLKPIRKNLLEMHEKGINKMYG